LRPERVEEMPLPNAKPLWTPAGDGFVAVIECSYESLSGHKYSSTTECNLEKVQVATTFND
jgi:hypothetical protein